MNRFLLPRLSTALLLSVSLLAAPFLVSSAQAASKVGTSAAVRGKVFVSTAGAARRARVRDAIKLQDKVLTKDNSALQILLLDRSTFTVGQNCTMIIDRFVYDPVTSAGKISAKVAKGAFRFMSGRIGKNNPTDATVSTPSATIGIRGTFFEGIVGEDAVALAQLGGVNTSQADLKKASITILRGPGRNRNSLDDVGIVTVSNSAGSVTIAQPHYAAFTPAPGVRPIGPFRMTPEMQDYLDFFLRSEPNGPTANPVGDVETGSQESGQDNFEEPIDPTDEPREDVRDGTTDRQSLRPNEEPPKEEEPPTEEPPVEEPPVEEPPVEEPPVEEPPTQEPPVEEPPTEDPPGEDDPHRDGNTPDPNDSTNDTITVIGPILVVRD